MNAVFFLCYRREDAGYAEALRLALASRFGAERVFKDVDSMALGPSWKDQVAQAIARSTHVLVLIGDGWMDGVDDDGRVAGHTDPVVFELNQAFERRVTVVPVFVGGAQMPAPNRLPASLRNYEFGYLNAGLIRPESPGSDIESLANRFARAIPPVAAPAPPRPRPAVPARRRRSTAPTILITLLVVLIVLAAAGLGLAYVFERIGGGSDPVLRLDPDSGPAGTEITATATGFDPGATVEFLFQARPVAETTADDDGTATATFLAQEGPTGTVTITATQPRSVEFDNAIFTLTG